MLNEIPTTVDGSSGWGARYTFRYPFSQREKPEMKVSCSVDYDDFVPTIIDSTHT